MITDTPIIGSTVRSAIALKLAEIFPDIIRYSERVINVRFPHFFIDQLVFRSQERLHNYYNLYYRMTIRYRISATPNIEPNMNTMLDDMAVKLPAALNIIDIHDMKTRLFEPVCEKVDGVLHFFANIVLCAGKKDLEAIRMGNLYINTDIKR